MKHKLLFILALAISQFSLAQVGNQFPSLQGQKLDNQTVTIPENTKGKYTLIGMVYSKEAEKDLATWFQPVYETFIHKEKGGLFETESYDIHLYFIPMITGINQAAYGKAVKEMQAGVDKMLWPYLLVYKGEIKEYKEKLQMDKKDLPYVFLLDQNGKIVYKTSGKYSDQKMEEIEKFLENNE